MLKSVVAPVILAPSGRRCQLKLPAHPDDSFHDSRARCMLDDSVLPALWPHIIIDVVKLVSVGVKDGRAGPSIMLHKDDLSASRAELGDRLANDLLGLVDARDCQLACWTIFLLSVDDDQGGALGVGSQVDGGATEADVLAERLGGRHGCLGVVVRRLMCETLNVCDGVGSGKESP